ncbi:hypothetical protein KAR91_47580 [Candidatus Pacearchaeota archaeon]|nr:hypothetical protein [Candidatus Pacearchaeota archaeon]
MNRNIYFEDYKEAGRVAKALRELGLWVEVKNRRREGLSIIDYYIEVLGRHEP